MAQPITTIDMKPQIALEEVRPVLRFSVSTEDARPFVLNSLLIVDAAGAPIWEYVKSTFEDVGNMELAANVMEVMTDEFRELLQSRPPAAIARSPHLVTVAHSVRYGATPVGYRQTFPTEGVTALVRGNRYRIVVFTSAGGANLAFDA